MIKISVIMPVWNRWATLEKCVKKLKEYPVNIVLIGSQGERSEDIARKLACKYVECENVLGTKLNAGLDMCRDSSHVIVMGSDNAFCDNAWKAYLEAINDDIDFFGFEDCYFTYPERKSCVYWKGYKGQRQGEPIGAFRMVSKRLLEEYNYRLWDDVSLSPDAQMWRRVKKSNLKKRIVNLKRYNAVIVDVKSQENITKFRKFPNSIMFNYKRVMDKVFK